MKPILILCCGMLAAACTSGREPAKTAAGSSNGARRPRTETTVTATTPVKTVDPSARADEDGIVPPRTDPTLPVRQGNDLASLPQQPFVHARNEDIVLTDQIRKVLLNDTSLSADGKTVTVVSIDGRVTLRGSVRSEAERKRVDQDVRVVAGPTHVEDELEVKE